MNQGQNSTDRETKLKTPGDVKKNTNHSVENRHQALLTQILADLWTNHFDPADLRLTGTVGSIQSATDSFGQPFKLGAGLLGPQQVLICLVTKLLHGQAAQIKILQGGLDILGGSGFCKFNLH